MLQREILDAAQKLEQYFSEIYEPKKSEPGREWPPKLGRVIGYQRSEFPTFSNVLLHVNGAKIEPVPTERDAARLVFDEESPNLNFSVIDGQHRINGAYLALKILQESKRAVWDIPTEIFLDLDEPGAPPQRQAQIFIDVNFYQKKVDRSLVADLFPTARGQRTSLDRKERAQDLGRILMLGKGPLVGMIQIPGIRYGVKDVITLATLNSGIEEILDILEESDIRSLDSQSEFLVQCLSAWFHASGRFEDPKHAQKTGLDPENVAYQGRVLVSILTLAPAIIRELERRGIPFVSTKAENVSRDWLVTVANKANLIDNGVFLSREKFKERRYLGAGGIALFRNTLWAAAAGHRVRLSMNPETIAALADKARARVWGGLRRRSS